MGLDEAGDVSRCCIIKDSVAELMVCDTRSPWKALIQEATAWPLESSPGYSVENELQGRGYEDWK